MSSVSSGSCLISWFTNLTSIGWKRSLTGSSTSTGTGSRKAALRRNVFFNKGGCFRRHGWFHRYQRHTWNLSWFFVDIWHLTLHDFHHNTIPKKHMKNHIRRFFCQNRHLCDLSIRCTMYGCRVSMLTAPSLGTSSLSRNQICKGLKKTLFVKVSTFP